MQTFYFCFNLFCFAAGIIIYTRYRQKLYHFEGSGRRGLLNLNTAAFIIGMLTIFGVSLVGNFQVRLFIKHFPTFPLFFLSLKINKDMILLPFIQ
jgi:hypothetical protein